MRFQGGNGSRLDSFMVITSVRRSEQERISPCQWEGAGEERPGRRDPEPELASEASLCVTVLFGGVIF